MDRVRIDKWLWAARFFKTRSLAARACELGRVEFNGQLAKAAREIRPGDRLQLIREPDNRHDRNAVRIEWKGQQLGYVPRAENRAVARALDAGEKLEGRVSKLRNDPDPWRRVEFEVYLVL